MGNVFGVFAATLFQISIADGITRFAVGIFLNHRVGKQVPDNAVGDDELGGHPDGFDKSHCQKEGCS